MTAVAGTARLSIGGCSKVRLGILGPIEIWDDSGTAVSLTPQLRRLLGLLVVAAGGSSVSTERIAEHVADRRTDGSVIRTAVSRLRKSLGTRIETTTSGYRLIVDADELDSARFVELCETARTACAADRHQLLTEGLGLWRGRALDEFADEPWAIATAARMQELRTVAVEDLGEVLIELGRSTEAVPLLEDHVVEHPFRERPIALLMRALAASGRVTESLRWFQRFRSSMREQIGIEPTSALRELEAELLGGLDPERSVAGPAPRRLPDGTVTFMFTDIEGSTERWQNDELAMSSELVPVDGDMACAHRERDRGESHQRSRIAGAVAVVPRPVPLHACVARRRLVGDSARSRRSSRCRRAVRLVGARI